MRRESLGILGDRIADRQQLPDLFLCDRNSMVNAHASLLRGYRWHTDLGAREHHSRTRQLSRLPDRQIDSKPFNHVRGDIHDSRVIRFGSNVLIGGSDAEFLALLLLCGDMFGVNAAFDSHLSAKGHFKELGAAVTFLEHSFVIRRGEVWHNNLQRRSCALFNSHAFAFDIARGRT